jgi:hypothetical protein
MVGSLGAKTAPEGTQAPIAEEHPTGYHRLGAFMGSSRRMSIFRRFGNLTMLNLLTLQAELSNLEFEYRVVHLYNNEDDKGLLSTSVAKLKDSGDYQWELALQIRVKLKEYRTCLAL